MVLSGIGHGFFLVLRQNIKMRLYIAIIKCCFQTVDFIVIQYYKIRYDCLLSLSHAMISQCTKLSMNVTTIKTGTRAKQQNHNILSFVHTSNAS